MILARESQLSDGREQLLARFCLLCHLLFDVGKRRSRRRRTTKWKTLRNSNRMRIIEFAIEFAIESAFEEEKEVRTGGNKNEKAICEQGEGRGER
jgi:hypothetical protein